jgi:hypothetical protein
VKNEAILMYRLESLYHETEKAHQVLKAIANDSRDGKQLLERVKNFLANVRFLSKEVEKPGHLDSCWKQFFELREKGAPLFSESLAIALRPLIRKNKIDGGFCAVADTMLEQLSERTDMRWGRPTILADVEAIVDLTHVIRFRFPVTSVWELPVAAHEFGHFIGIPWEKQDPLKKLIGDAKQTQAHYEAWIREHFADTFATFALGPAYAYSCLLLRFHANDPDVDPNLGYWTHPSDAMRAYGILEVLKKMNNEDGSRNDFSEAITTLEGVWKKDWAAGSDREEIIKEENRKRIDCWLNTIYDRLRIAFPRARYQSWSRANELKGYLEIDPDVPENLSADKDTIADVLNAAWLARIDLHRFFDPMQLSERTLPWCIFLGNPK